MSNHLQPLTAAEIKEREVSYEKKVARLKRENKIDMAFYAIISLCVLVPFAILLSI
tara:strand:+ start:737 stop:904 length:168 start_codon:yes stop_codon:yes gene_type:complete